MSRALLAPLILQIQLDADLFAGSGLLVALDHLAAHDIRMTVEEHLRQKRVVCTRDIAQMHVLVLDGDGVRIVGVVELRDKVQFGATSSLFNTSAPS